MNEQLLKSTITEKLAYYRKRAGLTQAEVAERINYSDKSVSKWERGDGLPDVITLALLAEIYGITLNDFLSEEIPEELPEEEPVPETKLQRSIVLKNKATVVLMSVGLVWLIAALIFFITKLAAPQIGGMSLIFLFAVPVSCIIAVVFSCLWGTLLMQGLSVSALVWSIATCFDVCVPLENSHLIYIVAAILQVLVVLWYIRKYTPSLNPQEDIQPEGASGEPEQSNSQID